MELIKLLSTNEIVAQMVSFLILLFILRKFAWGAVLKALDDRKNKIAEEFSKIDQTRQEIDNMRMEYDVKFSNIENTANEKIKEAVAEGKKLTEDLRKQAHLESQRIIETTRTNLRFEITKARQNFKDEMVNLVMKTTEFVLEQKVTEEMDKKVINDFLSELDKTK